MNKCSHYIQTRETQGYFIGKFKQCTSSATGRIVAPDGWEGGKLCTRHGNMITREYQEHLNENWRMRPLTEIEQY